MQSLTSKASSSLPQRDMLVRANSGRATLPYLSFTPEQLSGINQSDLTGDYLEVPVPLWPGMRDGDVLTPWLGTSETEGSLITETEVVAEAGTSVLARFPKALLLANGDTTQYFGYQLCCVSGDECEVSRKRGIDVSLKQSRPTQGPRFKKALISPLSRGIGTLALPALRPPGSVFADGTIPVALLTASLPIEIDNVIPEFPEGSVIQLYRLADDGTRTPLGPQRDITKTESETPGFVFELEIPLADFPTSGTTPWTLEYSVYDPLSGAGPLSGAPVNVIFDREAPGGNQPIDMPLLEFTPDQLSGITLADVVGTSIPVILPAWYLSDVGDKVQLWLSTSDAQDDTKYLPGTFDLPIAGEGITVEFEISDIEPLGNTTLYFAYQLTDKAGNVSTRSNTVAIAVLLTNAPTNLLAPEVPDYLDHGLVTQKDAAELVEVKIPNFDNAAAGDRIYVVWGGTTMPPVSLLGTDLNPAAGTPLKVIKLPYALVLSEGSGNGKAVSYEVWRGALRADTSPATSVDVNLDSPGPDPDPDPETPWHENLVPLVVVSDSGAGTGGDNIIPPGDFNKPALATIPHLGKDGAVIWKAGDRVQISWDGVLVGTPVPITTANVGADLQVTIPAATVSSSTGLKDVFYIVSRDLTPGSEVATAESEPTVVNVLSAGLLPGDGSLAGAIFPEEDPAQNVVNRTTGGLDGTPIRITLAGVTNIGVNNLISLRFVGRQSLSDPTAAEIVGTELSVTDHIITSSELSAGYFELDIPYNPYLQKICRNGCTVDYSITNTAGSVSASQKFIKIVLDQPGSIRVCAINPTAT